MFATPFLDTITNYDAALVLNAVVNEGQNVIALIALGFFGVDVFHWETNSSRTKAVKVTVHLALLLVAVFSIVYGSNGRYTKTDINTPDSASKTYFGTTTNGLPDGFGKIFDTNGNIEIIGEFKGGKPSGHCTTYQTSADGNCLVTYDGDYAGGVKSGHGTQNAYDNNGALNWTYIGGFTDDTFVGNGTIIFFDDNGNPYYEYEGGWYRGKRFGYGIETHYEAGVPTSVFRGQYSDDDKNGEGVDEYYTGDDGEYVVWHGIASGGEYTEESAYYHGNTGEPWATTLNNTQVQSTDNPDEYTIDEERLRYLSERWTIPETLELQGASLS